MISIVVPVYNEDKNIAGLLNEINTRIKTEKEIIIVYDHNSDTTLPILKEIKDSFPFQIITVKNEFGRGALNAIKTGFCKADKETVLVMMADLSDNLIIVDDMYNKIHYDNYDIVCGSRYMKGGRQNGGPLLKGVFSRTAGVTLHFLTRIPTHDITNSFKMYRKKILENIIIESDGGFEIGMEITVKAYAAGYRITEIPDQWYDRKEGVSRFMMRAWIPKYLKWWFYCIKSSWFKNRKTKANV